MKWEITDCNVTVNSGHKSIHNTVKTATHMRKIPRSRTSAFLTFLYLWGLKSDSNTVSE